MSFVYVRHMARAQGAEGTPHTRASLHMCCIRARWVCARVRTLGAT